MNLNPLKSKLNEYDAFLFDMDGTLLDSMWMWKKIDIEYLGRFHIEIPEGLQRAVEGKSFSETAVYFKEHFDIPDDLDTIKRNWNEMACDKYRYEVPYKEGALEFLQWAKDNHKKMGVATSNSRELVEHADASLGLRKYMDCIMTAGEVQRGKPAPDIYLAVADKLGVAPERCLVFEDILPGIWAGHNAGMKVCAVEDAYSAPQRAEKMKLAEYYITSYFELL